MKKMVNIISIIMASLIMITAFCFVGCTPKENNSTPEPTAQPTSEPQIEDGTPLLHLLQLRSRQAQIPKQKHLLSVLVLSPHRNLRSLHPNYLWAMK